MLVFRQPRLIVPAISAVVGILIASMWWARITPVAMMHNFQQGNQLLTTWMHETPGISLVPLFEPLGLAGTFLIWAGWLALFALTLFRIKDSFIQLSALLVIAVLPIHHRDYDMIVSALVIALLLKRGRLLTALVVTAAFSGLWDTAAKQQFFGIVALQNLNIVFHQLTILGLIVILFWLDYKSNFKDGGLTMRCS